MVVQVQVVSVDSSEMTPSLMVSTEFKRFLFNVGDGTQRMCMEHHLRLAKLSDIFLTELGPHTVGGLPGMILTISDTGKDRLQIHGPEGTKQWLRATRHFLMRPSFTITANDLTAFSLAAGASGGRGGSGAGGDNCVYRDEELSIHAVVMHKPRTGTKRRHNGSIVDATSSSSPSNTSSTSPLGSPVADYSTSSCVCYIVETAPQRGKFLVEKAIALGVPKGRFFGQLHRGEDVTLPDGRVVKSSDCVAPSIAASGFLLVTCPSIAMLDQLVTNAQFAKYQHQTSESDPAEASSPALQLQVVFHLADPSIFAQSKYVDWAKRFGDQVHHVLLNHPRCNQRTGYRASARLHAELHTLFPQAFPSFDREHNDAVDTSDVALVRPSSHPLVFGESLLKYTLAPIARRGFDFASLLKPLDREELDREMQSLRGQLASSSPAIESTDLVSSNFEQGRLTFLGTGSAIPSKYRNVTGMLLEFPVASIDSVPKQAQRQQLQAMLLDCGEGSFGQLWRMVNGDATRMQAFLRSLHFVWISHNHADHHLGLLRVLSQRHLAMLHAGGAVDNDDDKVLVMGPPQVKAWLAEYEAVDASIKNAYWFVDSVCFDQDNDAKALEMYPSVTEIRKQTLGFLTEKLGVTSIETVRVKHCHLAYALVMEHDAPSSEPCDSKDSENKKKLVFSGDCRPSDSLARKSRGAHVMIHEATFENSMQDEAESKNHCTIQEALDVGAKAQAHYLVLTHFSQRYPKFPKFDESLATKVMAAFDLLQLDLKYPFVPQFMEVASMLLQQEPDDEEDNGEASVTGSAKGT